MRLDSPSVGLSLMLVAWSSLGPASSGADSDPAATLKARGLTKAGSLYVIEPEKAVVARLKAARSALAEQANLAERRKSEEQVADRLAEVEEHRSELQKNLADMNQRIIEQLASQAGNSQRPGPGGMGQGGPNWNGTQGGVASPLTFERDRIKQALAELDQEQKALKAEAAPTHERGGLDDEAKQKAEALKKTLAELRTQVDEVTRKYAELGADPAIKQALADLSRSARTTIKLGPTDAFLSGVRALDQAERRLLGKPAAGTTSRKKKAKSRR